MTPLRRRMVEDMKVRRFAGSTQYNYIKCVERLAQHFGRSPGRMGPEEVRAFLVYLVTEASHKLGTVVRTKILRRPVFDEQIRKHL